MSPLILRLAALLVPRVRREEWLEQWRAELWALDADTDVGGGRWGRTRFALGAVPDALAEAAAGWREGWSLAGLAADARAGWRALARAPVTSLATALIVGAGTAATATVFSLADATLIRAPRGVTDPDTLFQLGRHDAASFDNFSVPNLLDLQAGLTGVADLAAYANRQVVVGEGADARIVPVQAVTPGYFRVLGVSIDNGPGLTPAPANTIGRSAEAVASRAFVRKHARLIDNGGTLAINGVRHRVVGVADADFAGAEIGTARPELWVTPAAIRGGDPAVWEAERGNSWLWMIGRRHPGVSLEEARAAARTVHASLAAAHPGLVGETITVVDGIGLRPADRAVAERLVGAFLGVAALVLLVAASNAAGVQVARALDRRRELTVRVSLGASRPRVLRGLLVEQALLALAGAGAAFVLTYWSTAWLRASLPYDLSASFGPDVRLLLFALAAAVGVTALVAAVPLWRVAGGAVQRGVRDGGQTHSRQRIGTALVVAQLAVSSALLIVGGVLTRSLLAAAQADPGFSTERVLTVSLRAMPGATGDPAVLVDDIRRRIAEVPGVAAVAAADALPVVSPQSTRAVATPDAAYDPDARRVPAVSAAVDPALFEVLGLTARHGRLFTPDDAAMARAAAGDPVPAVVTASLADRLFGERSAVGQLIQSGPLVARVVGVVDPLAVRSVRDSRTPAMWTPFDPARDTPAEIAVLTRGASAAVADEIRAALAPLSSSAIVRDIAPLSARVAASLSSTLAGARVTAAFGLTALAIAVVGLFGVVASRVARLRREFGVRLALGARPATLVRAVLVWALVPAVAGAMLGIGVVAAGQRQIAPLLFGVSALDPLVVLLTVAVMSATALVSALGPARRAARTDPLVVIRAD